MQENNLGAYGRRERDCQRYNIDAFASIIFNKNTKKAFMIKDVSARGLRGQAPYSPEVGEKVEIVLSTPFFENPVKKEARVAWCKKIDENLWEIGLDFGLDNKLVLGDKVKDFLNKLSGT